MSSKHFAILIVFQVWEKFGKEEVALPASLDERVGRDRGAGSASD